MKSHSTFIGRQIGRHVLASLSVIVALAASVSAQSVLGITGTLLRAARRRSPEQDLRRRTQLPATGKHINTPWGSVSDIRAIGPCRRCRDSFT